MNVVKVTPRGYCHGVVDALNIVARVASDENTKTPIYILGEIVHNQNVTQSLTDLGVITLNGASRQELLNQVNSGTVIITAHGIDKKLIDLAKERGLEVVDATCKDVYKTHHIIQQHLDDDYAVIYIGKKNHPETEGCIAISDDIHLVTSVDDVSELIIDNPKVCVTNQTTLSMWDMQKIVDALKVKLPQIKVINEICNATEMRQQAVSDLDPSTDLLFVVGDKNSNNTNKLVEIAQNIVGCQALRIDDVSDIDISKLNNDMTVAVTSGASTPTIITTQVIKFLQQLDVNDEATHKFEQLDLSKIIPRIR